MGRSTDALHPRSSDSMWDVRIQRSLRAVHRQASVDSRDFDYWRGITLCWCLVCPHSRGLTPTDDEIHLQATIRGDSTGVWGQLEWRVRTTLCGIHVRWNRAVLLSSHRTCVLVRMSVSISSHRRSDDVLDRSETWFGLSSRTTVTGLIAIANPFGGAVGDILAPAIVTNPSDLTQLLFIVALVSTGVVPLVFLVGSRPRTPPTRSAEERGQKVESGWHSFKVLLGIEEGLECRERSDFWIIAFVSGRTRRSIANDTNHIICSCSLC